MAFHLSNWLPRPLVWHSLPCEHDGLAQLLVLFSYEILPWEGRGKQGQMGSAECWGGSADGGCLALAERGSELSNSAQTKVGRRKQVRQEELFLLPFPSFRLFRNGLSFFS